MKSKSILRLSSIVFAAALSSAHAADITLTQGTYTDIQTYNNGTISGVVTFDPGANYTFDSLNLPLAWNRVVLNSGASLNVAGNISVDFSGLSLNGGTLTAGGLLLHDAPNWAGSIADGKQSIEQGESIINGATIIANQSNSSFISFIGSTSTPAWDVFLANNLWLGNDGATIDSNGNNIGITMALGNFSGQSGSLTKAGAGTLTLSANNSYSAGTTVNQGVLEIAGSSAGNSYIRGTATVNSGAELRYTGGDGTGFGFNGGNKIDALNINGGLVNSQGGMTHIWNATVNMTGGELRVNGGVSSPTGDRIEWNNTTVNTSASSDTASITGRINFRADNSSIAVFNVADGTAATDLLVSAAITQSAIVGITKNGAGTMELSGSNSYTGTTTVNEGTLKVNTASFSDTSAVVIALGAKIDLNFAGSDIVGSLVIDGTTVPSGSYSDTHPIYGDYIDGTGTLQVGAPGPQVSGTWTASASGNWSDSGNWQSGNVANGTNNTATFNPGAAVTVTVDGNRFIGGLAFTGFDTTLAGSEVLTLDNTLTQPHVSVANGLTATLATDIGGTLGLEKTDPGTLVLTGAKSYTGGTIVTGGTLELSGATGGNAQIHGSVTVSPGATLAFTNGDGTGFGFLNNPVTTINVDGGTITAASGSHLGFGTAMTMTLENGATLQGSWQWNGDALLNFSSFGDSTNTISGFLNLRNDGENYNHSFNVDDGTSATDLLISGTLAGAAANVIKTGTGTLTLTGDNTYTGNTVVNDGTLSVTAAGTLQFRPTTNGTTNSVSGSSTATLSFLGTVDLDLNAADATLNNSWNLFNLASFSAATDLSSIAAVTSSLGAFTEVTPGTWELPVTGAKWVFTEANGNLAYVNAATDYDTWKTANGVTGGPNDDDDADGLTNFEEYAFGLDPTGGSLINPIVSQLNKSTGKFSYTRRKPSLGTGLDYSVWFSTNLATWTEDAGATEGTPVPSGDNETVEVTLSTAPGSPLPAKLFIQVRAN